MAAKNAKEAVSEFKNWLDVWTQAQERARTDDAFRSELLQDPRAALKKHFKYKLDPKIDLSVVEEGQKEGAKLTLHLPSKRSKAPNIRIAC
ncbi:hypothetical protein [Hyalangium minutum]|uniref:hypothetical protein n=1 Tax=Hyalangium minutum TaxID=394096 RepID=UPI0005C6190B|nr:hypothetical protein [Hyalangium minutum]